MAPVEMSATRQRGDDERAVMALVEQSALARGAAGLAETLYGSLPHSRLASAWSHVALAWRSADRATRLRAAGIALLAAVVVHLAMSALRPPAAGWLWLVLPAIAVAEALLLIAAASGPRTPRS
jgi:hypothetical protein